MVQEEYTEIVMDAVGFGMCEWWKNINPEKNPHTKIDVVYTLEENHWNGFSGLQLMIKDLKISK